MYEEEQSLRNEPEVVSVKKLVQKEANEVMSLRGLALTASFTALVFLATSLFYLALTSNGFFNLGEAFIYVAAMIGGPFVGAVAGGVGASMADLVLGYPIFAPATFVVKGLEGFIAGVLFHYSKQLDKKIRYLIIGFINITMIVLSSLLFNKTIGGGFYFYGLESNEIYFEFPGYVILIIALVLTALIWVAIVFLKEKGEMIIACLSAGVVIIIGYFLYEWILYGIGPALAEIPFNIGQVIFGTAIAIPVVSYLKQLGIFSETVDSEEK